MKKFYLFIVAALVLNTTFAQSPFFTQTSYRGAFGTGPGANWMAGWSNFDPRNTAYPGNGIGESLSGKTAVEVTTDISVNTIWTSNNVYYLNGPIAVKSGVTLTIQAGTFIRGRNPGSGISYLVIARGGRLISQATASNPIVMTSDRPAGSRNPGDWGGLMICGNAPTNLNNSVAGWVGERNFEATLSNNDTRYGNAASPNPNDNSGVFRYMRVEFAGDAALPNQELNGIMLAGVGRATTFEYMQVSYANDDSFEWFGGTVNCRYLIAMGGTDDDLDIDEGYSGFIQFAFVARHPNMYDTGTAGNNSNLFELDNNTTSGGVATSNPTTMSPVPPTSAVISNVTAIGPLRPGEAATAVNTRFAAGVNCRTNPSVAIFNSIIIGAQDQIFNTNTATITGVPTGPSNFTKLSCDSLVFRGNYFGMDNGNANNLVSAGGFAGTTGFCGGPTLANATDVLTFLGNNGNTLQKVTNLNSTFLGIASPYYGGTPSDPNTFGFAGAGTVTFSSIDPTLTAGSIFLSGSDFSHPRIGNFLLPQSITVTSAQTLGNLGYVNVTVTSTGNLTLSGGLNITGTITVQNGGTLTMGTHAITGTGAVNFQAGANISTARADGFANTLNGALRNSGIKTLSTDANYTFNGTVAQSTGSFFAGSRDLNINNAAGVTLSALATVGGVLRLQAGAFNIGNNLLTVNSTATRQGVIDNFTGGFTGSITGTSMRFRRFTRGNNFRHFVSPLSGASNTLGSAVLPAGFACGNIREFDEPANNWIPVINPCNAQPTPSMQSFIAFAYGNRTLEFSGMPLNGTQTVPLVRSTPVPGPFIALGWNPVGNPYPSAINWSGMAAIPGNTTASNLSAYIYNSTTGNYGIVTSAGVASGGASNTIAPGQGILVRSLLPSTNLTFNNSVRTSGSAQTFIRKAIEKEIRFTLAGNNTSDEVVLLSGADATNAEKLFSPESEAVSLYIPMGEGEPLTFKALSSIDKVVPLAIKVPSTGKYTFTAEMISGLDQGVKATLEDKVLGTFTELTEGFAYTFNAKEGSSNRFAVHFGGSGVKEIAFESSVFLNENELNVLVTDGPANNSQVTIIDLSGKKVFGQSFEGNKMKTTINLNAGIYNVLVVNGGVTKNHKLVVGK